MVMMVMVVAMVCRYEHEQLVRQELDDKLQQAYKKFTFNEQIQAQQVSLCDMWGTGEPL